MKTYARQRIALAIAIACISAILGCRHAPIAQPSPPPSTAQLTNALLGRRRAVSTLRSEARFTYWDDSHSERVKATVLFWAVREGKLRMDIDSPFGSVATLATDGRMLSLLDTRKDRFFEGPASACAVSQFLPITLPPGDVVDALLGDAPLPSVLTTFHRPLDPQAVRWDGERGLWMVVFREPNGAVTLLGFAPDMRLVFAEAKEASGKLAYRLRHEDFHEASGVWIPKTSRLELDQGREIIFERRDYVVNQKPPEHAFRLLVPAGLPVTPLPCEPATAPVPSAEPPAAQQPAAPPL